MKEAIVISLGGSVMVPNRIDTVFLRRFAAFVRWLAKSRRVIVVAGGGATARAYLESARQIGVRLPTALHWIGVRACQLNAELLRAALGIARPVLMDPEAVALSQARITVAAPPQAGGTSDFRTVIIARRVYAKAVFNITNVDGVYTADPGRYRRAKRLAKLSWSDYRKMFGSTVRPGAHFPFDPVAARAAAAAKLEVMVLSKNIRNLQKATAGRVFRGTRIGPA
ncbi:MAG: UMP kinase [Candidatus Kerfeldbacteria bacterium]|nr:UMP kinase [Candidatus Kerfeldbacteria bacterium]